MKHYIVLHIKVVRGNIFLILSDNYGQLILSKNSGSIGFKHMQKRSVEALHHILDLGLNTLLGSNNKYFFLKLEGINRSNLQEIYKKTLSAIKKSNLKILGFKVINKIPHNGCRKKK